MSQHRVTVLAGAIFVGLGVILLAASIIEQPPDSASSPNRFYSAEEAAQYHADRRRSQEMLARLWGGEGLQVSTRPLSDDVIQQMGEIGARITAAQKKQAAAHQRQQRLSRTLNWLGLGLLAAGSTLLLLARRSTSDATTA
jgi:hypothetical protein